jgi:pyrroline-5-carboxylate reductase
MFQANRDIRQPVDDIIAMLAIKPQIFDQKARTDFPDSYTDPNSYVTSMMAGKSGATIQQKLGVQGLPSTFMPNLNAEVNEGVVGYVQSPDFIDDPRQATLEAFLQKSNLVIDSSPEDLKWITAESGSGPAFVMELIKVLEADIMRAQAESGSTVDQQVASKIAVEAATAFIADAIPSTLLEPRHAAKIESWMASSASTDMLAKFGPGLRDQLFENINNYITGAREGALLAAKPSAEGEPPLLSDTPNEAKLNAAILGTIVGTGSRYLASGETLTKLQDDVTSKGGTTYAGRTVLEARGGVEEPHPNNTNPITVEDMVQAIYAAINRFIELS